jgi:MFS family permease
MISTGSSHRPADSGYLSPAYAWYVVGVLLLANILSCVDRTIISLLIPDIKRDLQITDTQVSLLGGVVFAAFYSVAGLPIGRLVDSRSRAASSWPVSWPGAP